MFKIIRELKATPAIALSALILLGYKNMTNNIKDINRQTSYGERWNMRQNNSK